MGDEPEVVSAEAESDAEGESAAGSVAGGIFLSRIFGLLRERALIRQMWGRYLRIILIIAF